MLPVPRLLERAPALTRLVMGSRRRRFSRAAARGRARAASCHLSAGAAEGRGWRAAKDATATEAAPVTKRK